MTLAFNPDGKTLASASTVSLGGQQYPIELWDISTGAKLRTLIGHSRDIYSVAFNADGRILASGSKDEKIKLWDVSTGAELRAIDLERPNKPVEFADAVRSVVFSPDSKTIFSAGLNGGIHRWDIVTGAEVQLWKIRTADELRSASPFLMSGVIALSPDGNILAGCGGGLTQRWSVRLWDISTGEELRTLRSHSNPVFQAIFSHDGKIFANGTWPFSGRITMWDTSSGVRLGDIWGLDEDSPIAFSPDDKTLAGVSSAIGSRDRGMKLWDVRTGEELRIFKEDAPISDLTFSPDGKMLASAYFGYIVKLWDVATGRELRTLSHKRSGRDGFILTVAFSPDGKTLAGAGDDNTIQLWDVSNGAELRTFEGHSDRILSIAFSPDGQVVASASSDNTIRLWGVSTGKVFDTLVGHRGPVLSVSFSPGGKTLATGGSDRTIKIWDMATGQELRALTGHSNYVRSVAFSPNGKLLISVGGDSNTKIWDPSSGKELGSLAELDRDEWLVTTPDGLFDGSPAAWKLMVWRFSQNTSDFTPVEAFFNEFYYPNLLGDILAGKSPQAPQKISQKDRRQPQLKLTVANGQSTVPCVTSIIPPPQGSNACKVRVKIEVTDASAGAQDVRLFRNGTLVNIWRGDVLKGQSRTSLEANVSITAGRNILTAYAFNHDNIKSPDAQLTINSTQDARPFGTIYLLVVGINRYENSQFSLKYAVPDAQAFAAELKSNFVRIGTSEGFIRLRTILLIDHNATKKNILLALNRLSGKEAGRLPAGAPTELTQINLARPEDAVVIYFAGHGTAQEDRFYLIPHDLGYKGARQKIDEAGLSTILSRSISDRELEQAFEGIDAEHLLLVIDACNSGQALEAEEKRRGPMNSKGLAQLAYEKGMYILAASQSYQAALGSARLGHGYLTYALVEEGLKTLAADASPKDGQVTLREWLDYAAARVPQMQEEESKERRDLIQPGANAAGQGRKDTPRENVQRPRVFYRREAETSLGGGIRSLIVVKSGMK